MNPILSWTLCAILSLAAAGHAAEPSAVKWRPGHYVLVPDGTPPEQYLWDHFRGIQKRYDWKNLEPRKDQYDFAEIKKDLAFLRQHEKCLVIQLQTKAFGEGANVSPGYLAEPEFGGGFYKTTTGSSNPVIWNAKVNARLIALYRALGKEFDSDPCLEAMVIPETAPSSSICRGVPQKGVAPYTVEKFTQALKDGMKALKEAFPRTVVIQYTNFPKEALEDLTQFQSENGIGLGGPDIRPYDSGLSDPASGIYRLYPRVDAVAPLGAAVQSSDYLVKRHNGPFDPTPVKEIYEFARDKLHLNYMFWLNKKGYFEKVLDMMNDPSFPKDPAGGLNAESPNSVLKNSLCAGENSRQ